MMGNYYLVNRRRNWAAVCISKNACTSLKMMVLTDHGIESAGKGSIHNRIGYSADSPFLQAVAQGRPPGCFCFAVWRDPVERFISAFRHFALDGVQQGRLAHLPRHHPEAWVEFAEEHLRRPALEQDEHFRRQTDYYDRKDIDLVVTLDALGGWFAGRGWGRLPHTNRSHTTFALPESLAARIRVLYAADYDLRPLTAGDGAAAESLKVPA